MFFTYILQSEKDKNLYVGFTDNVEKRLRQHNEGINISTKSRAPFKLLYYEALPTREEALRREKFYKSGRGHEVLKKILFVSLNAEIVLRFGGWSRRIAEIAKVVTAEV